MLRQLRYKEPEDSEKGNQSNWKSRKIRSISTQGRINPKSLRTDHKERGDSKDGTIRFLTDFRGMKSLVKKKYPLPLIDDIMISVENFTLATALELSMRYYAMILVSQSRKYCTVILPWGLY